jgi:hypothetical protein
MPRRKGHVPATTFIHLRVTVDERERIEKRAGDMDVASYLRTLLGLPARKVGRPRKLPPPKPPK